ncbi:MAG: Gfo/Idh/MocA family oxidoreductase [Verrucomicrobia bacterium]|nr:Gfo/Idh/MocA family oxidoreductase [Verrucomicrobiota bacterium]
MNTPLPPPSRRTFLKTAAVTVPSLTSWMRAGAAPAVVGGKSLNSRIGIGFIGTGGRAGAHMRMLESLRDQEKLPIEFAAVCDVNWARVEKAQARLKAAKAYLDYRQLLADPAVDVVCIATPDHHHGQQAIDALQAGKHVYCEKPVTHWRQFALTRQLADVAARSPCAFQCGTQAMSDGAWHQMRQLVQEGLIGRPLFGETGFFRIGDWGERGMKVDDPNLKPGPGLYWMAFQGDAPKREFSVDRLFRWRLFEDYAGGPVTDLYPHCLTQVIYILGVGFPEKVVALGGIHRYDYELRDVPDTFNLIAEYPEKVTISVLGTQANDYNATPLRGAGQRCPVIRGWEGSLSIDTNNKDILFTPLREKGAKPPQRIPITHPENNLELWKNLLTCAREGRKDTWSPAELAFRAQTVLHMAMQAHRRGVTAKFDSKRREIV